MVRPEAVRNPESSRRWLLFVHQVPSTPSNLRVRTWRRLQQIGAIPIKQSVYLLPDSPNAREDFEWLKTEIKGAGGDANVFAADSVDSWSDDAIVGEFRRSRQEAYTALARDVEQVLRRLKGKRRPRGARAPAPLRLLEMFQQRFAAIESIDFFGSAGRDRVSTLLGQLEERAANRASPLLSTPPGKADPQTYRGRLWVTRPRPGVDRMASAWLIQRFIDPGARFAFAPDRESVPSDAIAYDMFGVSFSHQGEGCTFETLSSVFGIEEPSVTRLAAIVHDLDLKDARFGAPETATVGMVIEGITLAHVDDDALLRQGIALFEALYRAFEQSARRVGARPRKGRASQSGKTKK